MQPVARCPTWRLVRKSEWSPQWFGFRHRGCRRGRAGGDPGGRRIL